MDDKKAIVTGNPWSMLRRFTDARIALGRAGVSLPTEAHLAFQLAHAEARDAVHLALDAPALSAAISVAMPGLAHQHLHSAAADRTVYLQRPDLGRRLDEASRVLLDGCAPAGRYDLAFIIADGLSALAIQQNAVPLLQALQPMVAADGLSVAPVCIVEQGRVAVGDEVGELLGARMAVVLIGERPGLSSPDSMGIYLTWMPAVGLTDAARNCISNVRPAGLHAEDAAGKLHMLLREAFRRQLTGVGLKDTSDVAGGLHDAPTSARSFLLGPAGD